MSEAPNNGLQQGIPLVVKTVVAIAIALVLTLAVIRLGGCKKKADDAIAHDPAPVDQSHLPVAFPPPLPTKWPDLLVEIESVCRNDADTVVVHWRYRNDAPPSQTPLTFAAGEPNVVALTQLRDATGSSYGVALSGTGVPLCSDIRQNGSPSSIYGGRSLPAWALFRVPATAELPLALLLHGIVGPAETGVKVPVLTAAEQAARAFVARETSWPDVWIQLDKVSRVGPQAYRVKWRYVNRNLAKPFTWGPEQPDLPARTQLFDFATGTYRTPSSASSIHGPPEAPATSIPAGGELPAEAVFDGVGGNHFQLIFHGAQPVYYDLTN